MTSAPIFIIQFYVFINPGFKMILSAIENIFYQEI